MSPSAPAPLTTSPQPTPDRPPRPADVALGGVVALAVDVVLPVALYYGLRAAAVGQVPALLLSGAPPAVRVAVVFARTRRVDVIGTLVLVALALGVLSAAIEGDARSLLVRNALFGAVFALWTLVSLRARRPLTYEVAISPAVDHGVSTGRRRRTTPKFSAG
jgi:hypothetical protein